MKPYIIPLEDLLHRLDNALSYGQFLTYWKQVPYPAFYHKQGRALLDKIRERAENRFPETVVSDAYTDPFLTEERLNHILRTLSRANKSAFRQFLQDMDSLQEFSFSDRFCSRVCSILLYLVQFRHYSLLEKLLRIAPWAGSYEDVLVKDRNCLYTYAIETIPKIRDLLPILETIDPGGFSWELFMARKTPTMAALEGKRYRALKLLMDKNMCTATDILQDIDLSNI